VRLTNNEHMRLTVLAKKADLSFSRFLVESGLTGQAPTNEDRIQRERAILQLAALRAQVNLPRSSAPFCAIGPRMARRSRSIPRENSSSRGLTEMLSLAPFSEAMRLAHPLGPASPIYEHPVLRFGRCNQSVP
jgi:hypothetical protein